MSLKIVHLATDAIAGMPYRLVEILKRNTDFEVSLIETRHRSSFPQDLVLGDDLDRARQLIESADIIHLHNNVDLDSSAFTPVHLRRLYDQGKAFVRQFHSIPETIARKMGCSVESLLRDPLPSLVINHCPERYYPRARVVPNLIPLNDPLYRPFSGPLHNDILYSPSKKQSAWSHRWNTKGMPETAQLLMNIEKHTQCKTRIVTDAPLAKVLYMKQRSYMILEEMVTGSYHLSGLEGVSMGKPTLAYLDSRTRFVMQYLSTAESIPFINTMLEHSEEVITYLLEHQDEGMAIGKEARSWMERYWSEEALLHHYIDTYTMLLEDPTRVKRQPDLELVGSINRFNSILVNDLIYTSRKKQRHFSSPYALIRESRTRFRKLWRGVRRSLKNKFLVKQRATH